MLGSGPTLAGRRPPVEGGRAALHPDRQRAHNLRTKERLNAETNRFLLLRAAQHRGRGRAPRYRGLPLPCVPATNRQRLCRAGGVRPALQDHRRGERIRARRRPGRTVPVPLLPGLRLDGVPHRGRLRGPLGERRGRRPCRSSAFRRRRSRSTSAGATRGWRCRPASRLTKPTLPTSGRVRLAWGPGRTRSSPRRRTFWRCFVGVDRAVELVDLTCRSSPPRRPPAPLSRPSVANSSLALPSHQVRLLGADRQVAGERRDVDVAGAADNRVDGDVDLAGGSDRGARRPRRAGRARPSGRRSGAGSRPRRWRRAQARHSPLPIAREPTRPQGSA